MNPGSQIELSSHTRPDGDMEVEPCADYLRPTSGPHVCDRLAVHQIGRSRTTLLPPSSRTIAYLFPDPIGAPRLHGVSFDESAICSVPVDLSAGACHRDPPPRPSRSGCASGTRTAISRICFSLQAVTRTGGMAERGQAAAHLLPREPVRGEAHVGYQAHFGGL